VLAGYFEHSAADLGDGLGEGGGAAGEAGVIDSGEPFGTEFVGALDVMGGEAGGADGFDEFAGVVAVMAADYDDEFDLFDEAAEGFLAVFGGAADGVAEFDLGVRAGGAQGDDELEDAVDGLGGLGDDAVERVVRDGWQIGLGLEDGGAGKVAGEAENLDVAVLADDDGEATLLDQALKVAVREADEGTGGVFDGVAGLAPASARGI